MNLLSFKTLDIKISYISCGDDSIAPAFLVPALKMTRLYQRSVGFFSSGVFQPIMDGIVALARNGGKIQLIASPKLSAEDIAAIKEGYRQKEEVFKSSFSRDFLDAIEGLNDDQLKLLVTLIAQDVLDIKLAVTKTIGDYHDKLGILEDFDGNTIVFYGSSNSSLNGYQNNYEKIRLVKSWDGNQTASIEDEKAEFCSLWNGTNPFVAVYNYKQSAQKQVLQIIDKRKNIKKTTEVSSIELNDQKEDVPIELNDQGKDSPIESDKQKEALPIELRDYQKKAIEAWVANDYHGFYVMATGTGKTWTAIFSAKKLLESTAAMIVVIAPYKHLIKQWAEDIIKAFSDARIVMVSSENPQWDIQITQEIIRKRYKPNTQIIIISTIMSFNTDRFNAVLSKSDEEKLLIVDEAHRLTKRDETLHDTYDFMLGLSATPHSGTSATKGNELMSFFGGQVFSLPIEEALGKYLANYYYRPIFINATEDEEHRFKYHSNIIASCFKNGVCIDPDTLVKALRNRLRVISMAEEKLTHIDEIVDRIQEKDHVVVYCGDGKLFASDTNEEIRHIRFIKCILDKHGYKPSQFTAKENMQERMALVSEFNKGNITALSAIRCLDEGINIPSIKSALILSSNDNYREFVQRRGRILRKNAGKDNATIYDVIVLPTYDQQAWARIEFRRYYEYARLSMNWHELEPQLISYLADYGLTIEDVDAFDYEEMENALNE